MSVRHLPHTPNPAALHTPLTACTDSGIIVTHNLKLYYTDQLATASRPTAGSVFTLWFPPVIPMNPRTNFLPTFRTYQSPTFWSLAAHCFPVLCTCESLCSVLLPATRTSNKQDGITNYTTSLTDLLLSDLPRRCTTVCRCLCICRSASGWTTRRPWPICWS